MANAKTWGFILIASIATSLTTAYLMRRPPERNPRVVAFLPRPEPISPPPSLSEKFEHILPDEYLAKTAPASWLASVDYKDLLDDSQPHVGPYRERLAKATGIYREPEREIAEIMLMSVDRFRRTGFDDPCSTMLNTAIHWAEPDPEQPRSDRSYAAVIGEYLKHRVDEGAGHVRAIDLMRESVGLSPVARLNAAGRIAKAKQEAASRKP